MFTSFREDIDRYVMMGAGSSLYVLLTKQGLWALAEYRFNRWILLNVHIPILKKILSLLGFIWHKTIEITTGIDIPKYADIGKGLYVGHFGGIILNPKVKIGDHCNLSHNVTIGVSGKIGNEACPKLGDRVFIGPGAVLIGGVTIGNDVAIGANAVVTRDLPDRAVAVGVPAKIIGFHGSKDIILFRDDTKKSS